MKYIITHCLHTSKNEFLVEIILKIDLSLLLGFSKSSHSFFLWFVCHMTSINPTQKFQNEHWLTSCRERLTCQRNMLFKKSLDINTYASHIQIMKATFSLTATLFFKFKLKRRHVHMKLTLKIIL